jgi:hypothetical protein
MNIPLLILFTLKRSAPWFLTAALMAAPGTTAWSAASQADLRGAGSGIALMAPDVLGQRAIAYDYSGVRTVRRAPPVGLHPRIYFESAELPGIRARLEATEVGREIRTMIRAYTVLLREGRSGYIALGEGITRMPDSTPRVDNVGLYDQSAIYGRLAAGDTSDLPAANSTRLFALGGQLALEAFECLLREGESDTESRQAALANAMAAWAGWALAEPDFAAFSRAADYKFGGHQLALAYDMAHGAMSPAQRDLVRKALAAMMRSYFAGESAGNAWRYTGVDVAPEALAANWVAINTFRILIACAIEGAVVPADAGYDAGQLDVWFREAMTSFQKFFTYGWHSNGAPYEGQGKNYAYAAHLVPLARRGFDFFGHPHLREYGRQWMPAVVEPFGYGFTKYDALGGSDTLLSTNDLVGMKWMYPDDVAVDFAYRNGMHTDWFDAEGERRVFPDARKLPARSVYQNDLLAAAIFAPEAESPLGWTEHNKAALGGRLDYLDTQGGTLITRSGFDPEASRLMVHVRQNFGGHTSADRNSFNFGALGRVFIPISSSRHMYQESAYQSVVHVNDLAMKVTAKDGRKMRIPAKMAGWKSGERAAFVTGDATYAYSWEWFWRNDGRLNPGFEYDLNTFNTFRRTGNKIPEAFGDIPFRDFPHWMFGGVEGVQRKAFQPMRQVYRTIGLVRSGQPYVLVVDDVRKDDQPHNYKWFASLMNDLEVHVPNPAPANHDAATDIVLKESGGDRCLLVRVLRAEGTPRQLPGSPGTSLGYVETVASAAAGQAPYRRLVIERDAVVDARFRVLLFPFRLGAGQALPRTTWSNEGKTLTVTTTTTDTFDFAPRTETVAGEPVTISEFHLDADGTAFPYVNLVEPAPVR